MASETGNHRVEIWKNPKYEHSGIKSYVYCLNKYNITPTTDGPYFCESKETGTPKTHGKFIRAIRRAVHKDSKGDFTPPESTLRKRDAQQKVLGPVPTEDQQNDALYLSSVAVGTPPQKLWLDFDTGSADLWFWSNSLPAGVQEKGRASGHAIFDSSKSSTFKAVDKSTWNITYGDGSRASGIVGTDTIKVGGVAVENQAVELASFLSAQFRSGVGDGLLGLAFGTINTVDPGPVKTPVENMIAQKDINKAIFTAYLGSWRDSNEDDKGTSFYTFGYIDPAPLKRAGVTEPYYVPIDATDGFWQFASTSATVNQQKISRGVTNTAIADTGTTLALVSDDLCKAIYATIPNARFDPTNQGWIYPTNTPAAKLPVVAFAVGDRLCPVQKEDLAFASVGDLSLTVGGGQGTTPFVYGAIQSRGTLPFDILGDTWLKSVYAIFDVGKKRFGIVERVEKHTNLTAPPA